METPSLERSRYAALRCDRFGKQHRDRAPRKPEPRPAHLHDPCADAPVGMAAASILPRRPIGTWRQIHRLRRHDPALRFGAERQLPVLRQRLHPDRAPEPGLPASRRLAGGWLRAAGPSGRPVALSGMFQADIGIGQYGLGRKGCVPIPRNPLRRQLQYPRRQTVDAGQKQKAVIAQHLPEDAPPARRPTSRSIRRAPSDASSPPRTRHPPARHGRKSGSNSASARPARASSPEGATPPSSRPSCAGRRPPPPTPARRCRDPAARIAGPIPPQDPLAPEPSLPLPGNPASLPATGTPPSTPASATVCAPMPVPACPGCPSTRNLRTAAAPNRFVWRPPPPTP